MAGRSASAESDEAIHWLIPSRPLDPAVAGPELALLSALPDAFPVPPGFCLPLTPGAPWGDDPASLAAAAERALASWPGPPPARLRVRSSPAGPYTPGDAGFAQPPAFHNVDGNAIGEAVVECAAPALARGRRRGMLRDGLLPGPMVVVQSFQPPDAWITACHEDHDDVGAVVRAHAAWGLREREGAAADSFVVDPAGLRIMERHTAVKTLMTVAGDVGVHQVEVPAQSREVPAVPDDGIRDAARAALEIRRRLGGRPARVDLEWSGDALSVLGFTPREFTPVTGRGFRRPHEFTGTPTIAT